MNKKIPAYKADALATIPGWSDLDAALEIASTIPELRVDPYPSIDAEIEDAIGRALALVTHGKTIPIDIADRAVAAQSAPEHARFTSVIHTKVLARLDGDRQEQIRSGSNAALNYLADKLDDLVNQVNDTAPHDTARLQHLVDCYGALRRAQQDIVGASLRRRGDGPFPGRLVDSVGLYRDSINEASYWVNWRASAARTSHPSTEASTAYFEWLRDRPPVVYDTDNSTSPWWPDDDPKRHLVAICAAHAVWLPTITTLLAVHAAAVTTVTPVNGPLSRKQVDARAKYHNLTQTEDDYAFIADAQPEPVVTSRRFELELAQQRRRSYRRNA